MRREEMDREMVAEGGGIGYNRIAGRSPRLVPVIPNNFIEPRGLTFLPPGRKVLAGITGTTTRQDYIPIGVTYG